MGVKVAGEAMAERRRAPPPVERQPLVARVVNNGVPVGVLEGEHVLGICQGRHPMELHYIRRLHVLQVIVRLLR